MTDDASQVFGLAEVLRILRRRWRWVAGTTVVVTALVVVLTLQQAERYTAEVRVLLRPQSTNVLTAVDATSANGIYTAARTLNNQIQVIESGALRRAVEADYSGDLSDADVTAEPAELDADAVVVKVTASDPDDAAELANTYGDVFVDYTLQQSLDALVDASTEIQARLDDVQSERDSVSAPLDQLDQAIIDNPGNQTLQLQRAKTADDLEARLTGLDNTLQTLKGLQENLALQQGLAPLSSTAQVLDEAEVPGSPTSPKPVRDAVIGVMLGLGLGFALALAREFLDEGVRSAEDLERVLQGRAPVLGVIPAASEVSENGLADATAHSAVAEAYRALRTSVKFAELDRSMRVIQVTSGSQGEGKTTTVANLAVMLAQAGHRVAVACCDLRRPAVHERFGGRVAPGLADVVLGECSLAEAVQPVGDFLYLLPAGTTPPNPSELLGSGRAERVIQALAEEMDYVLVDTTPVLPVTDAVVVSRFVDATIVVVAAGGATRNEVGRTLAALELASAPIVGVVLNQAELHDRNAYGYTYGQSGYGSRRSGYASFSSPTGRSGRRRGRKAEAPTSTAPAEEAPAVRAGR